MKFVNLTPHAVSIHLPNGTVREVPADGTVARVKQVLVPMGMDWGVPVVVSKMGPVEGLPAPVRGVGFIVSTLVRLACPDRRDLYSPADLVRDPKGQIIGCRALEVTPVLPIPEIPEEVV